MKTTPKSLAKQAADLVPETIDWSFWRDLPQGRGPVVQSFAPRARGQHDRTSDARLQTALQYARDQGFGSGVRDRIQKENDRNLALEAIDVASR